MEHFEWGRGIDARFGLLDTNYTDLTWTSQASMFTLLNGLEQHEFASAGGSGNYGMPMK